MSDPADETPIKLVTAQPQYLTDLNAKAIASLEDMLETAKQGRIVSVAIVAAFADGNMMTSRSPSDNRWVVLGGLMRLVHLLSAE